MAQHLCSIDYEHEMSFASVVGEPESERVVGISSYYVDPRTGLADVAYMVDPAWQGVGIGGRLHARMIEYARRHGVRGFTADVLPDNPGMLAVFRRSGCRVTTRPGKDAIEVLILFDEPAEEEAGAPNARGGRPKRGPTTSRASGRRGRAHRTPPDG